MPAVAQWRTRRPVLAVAWAGAVAGVYLGMGRFTRDREVQLEGKDPACPYTYADTVPTYPLRPYRWAAVGLLALGSIWEAYRYADRYYVPPEQTGP